MVMSPLRCWGRSVRRKAVTCIEMGRTKVGPVPEGTAKSRERVAPCRGGQLAASPWQGWTQSWIRGMDSPVQMERQSRLLEDPLALCDLGANLLESKARRAAGRRCELDVRSCGSIAHDGQRGSNQVLTDGLSRPIGIRQTREKARRTRSMVAPQECDRRRTEGRRELTIWGERDRVWVSYHERVNLGRWVRLTCYSVEFFGGLRGGHGGR